MAFDGSEEHAGTEQPPPVMPYELPPLIPPASSEPSWLIAVGLACFLGFLALVWWNHQESGNANPVSFNTSMNARTSTYFVEMVLYYRQDQDRQPLAAALPKADELADQAAGDWQQISKQSMDTGHQGLTALNAAALYHVAGDDASARDMLARAAQRDRPRAAQYHALLPLYGTPARPIQVTRQISTLLDQISAGPLVLARNAELRGKPAEIRAALQPGARAGQRLVLVVAVGVLGFLGLLIIMLLALVLRGSQVKRAVSDMQDTPGAEVPWGIGTGLIVVSLSYFTVAFLQDMLKAVFAVKDNPSAGMLVAIIATLFGPVIIVGLFLLALGRKPWEWGVLGWTPTRRGIRYGMMALLASLPVVFCVTWLSSMVFGKDQGPNPLIPELVASDGVLLKLLIVFTAVVVAPLVEETLFRGILFRAANVRLPFWTAAFASGFIFATGHYSLVGLLPITLLGMLFAFLTRRSQSLLASAGAHAVYNGIITAMLLLFSWAINGPGA
ncbi:MAG: CPBP family intramembrane glutamic endopeptidase [Armatimonadota bacterium]